MGVCNLREEYIYTPIKVGALWIVNNTQIHTQTRLTLNEVNPYFCHLHGAFGHMKWPQHHPDASISRLSNTLRVEFAFSRGFLNRNFEDEGRSSLTYAYQNRIAVSMHRACVDLIETPADSNRRRLNTTCKTKTPLIQWRRYHKGGGEPPEGWKYGHLDIVYFVFLYLIWDGPSQARCDKQPKVYLWGAIR